jgi:hypothetical protein
MNTTSILPGFFIVGAQKSGTTSLHHYLNLHPEIYFPPKPQEIHFFDNHDAYEKGIDWYSNYFKGASSDQIAGQTSPLYLYFDFAAERLQKHTPGAKIIAILRNPVDRAYSHYWNSIRYGYEYLSFEDALHEEKTRIKENLNARRNYSYFDRGLYSSQLENYRTLFPIENILVLTQDQLRKDPVGTLNNCCDFLGVSNVFFGDQTIKKHPRHNESRLPVVPLIHRIRPTLETMSFRSAIRLLDKSNLRVKKYPPMKPDTKHMLTERYTTEIATLKNWMQEHKGVSIPW